jgi:hypothetical protein
VHKFGIADRLRLVGPGLFKLSDVGADAERAAAGAAKHNHANRSVSTNGFESRPQASPHFGGQRIVFLRPCHRDGGDVSRPLKRDVLGCHSAGLPI